MRGTHENAVEIFDNYKVMLLDPDVLEKVNNKPSPLFAMISTGLHDTICLYSPAGDEDKINAEIEKFYNEEIYKGMSRKYIGNESFTMEFQKVVKTTKKGEPKKAVVAAVVSDIPDLPNL